MVLKAAYKKIRQLLLPEGNVTEQAVKSGVWSALLNVTDRGLQLGKLVILANLLAPSDFGLMGIALLSIAAFRRFSNLGLDSALIQRAESDVDKYLNTTWIMKISRGVAISIVAFLLAPYVAQLFDAPPATNIIRVIALSPILLSLQNPGMIYFRKELEFQKQFLYKVSSSLISVIIATSFALLYQNVWALVVGYIAGDIVKVFTSYFLHEYRPWFEFEIDIAKQLYSYGKWLTASSIVLFLVTQGDDAFVGWSLGATALGFYQLAYRFANAPASEITGVISSVVFPTYSKLQQDESQLQTGFLKTITLITVLSFPISAGLIVVTPLFVPIFLGSKWAPIIVPMQILGIFGASLSIGSATGPLYQAIGKPDIDTKLATAHVILLAPTIYFATTRWGLVGTAISVVVVHLLVTLADVYIALNILEINARRFLFRTVYPFFASVVMGVVVYTIRDSIIIDGGIGAMIGLIFIGVFTYFPLIVVMNRYLGYPIGDIFKTVRSAFV